MESLLTPFVGQTPFSGRLQPEPSTRGSLQPPVESKLNRAVKASREIEDGLVWLFWMHYTS